VKNLILEKSKKYGREILMFERIFVEEQVATSGYTQNILNHFPKVPITMIESIDDIWGRVKKPYLQKRDNLNLFIGKKNGELVKPAPAAYGLGSENHYYFVHAYNCIYECQYCYLQGYFNTPDIVLFVNHQEIIARMQEIVDQDPLHNPWFHAGEYSDSLALSHITQEWPLYWEFFAKNPQSRLELRTKSVNIKFLKTLPPQKNITISFSLSSHQAGQLFDNKCPSIKARLRAIEELASLGHRIGIHFDPIIYQNDIFDAYERVIGELVATVNPEQIDYVSVGVVRFTKPVYKEVEKNYPKSALLNQDFEKSFDNKVRYNHPMRMWILNTLKELCITYGIAAQKVYLCMEEDFN
jgi:spore photoproduct lyase